MAEGDYKLIKVNSNGTLDEKTILAESGKILGFNETLDPVMVTVSTNDTTALSEAIQQIQTEMANDYFYYPEINALRTRVKEEAGTYLMPLRLVDTALDELQYVPHSLLMLPFAAKAGKIYSIVPADGSGDLVVSRNSVKTVTGKNGMPLECPIDTILLDYSTNEAGFLIEDAAINLFDTPNIPVTQDIAVTAQEYTLQFIGSGSIVLSGAHAYTFEGTGGKNTYTFTPSAGTLTLTLSGVVNYPQLETGDTATSWVNGSRVADVVTVPIDNYRMLIRNNVLHIYPDSVAGDYTLPTGITSKLLFSKFIPSATTIKSLDLTMPAVNPVEIAISSSGTGVLLSAMNIVTSSLTVFNLKSKAPLFYPNSAGLDENNKAWVLAPDIVNTTYLKISYGTEYLYIPDVEDITEFGYFDPSWTLPYLTGQALVYGANTPKFVSVPIDLFVNAKTIHLINSTSTITGTLPTSVLHFLHSATYSQTLHEGLLSFASTTQATDVFGILPSSLTYLYLNQSATFTTSWAIPASMVYLSLTIGNVDLTITNQLPATLKVLYIWSTKIRTAFTSLPSCLERLSIYGSFTAITITGDLPSTLNYFYLYNASLASWVSSSPMPTGLTYLYLYGTNQVNWTGLDVSGTENMTSFALYKYRTTKMSSTDMITLLTSMKNRVGGLPSTCYIGDYADYASPPQGVVDAVAALKAAKPNVTTITFSI